MLCTNHLTVESLLIESYSRYLCMINIYKAYTFCAYISTLCAVEAEDSPSLRSLITVLKRRDSATGCQALIS